MNKMTATKPAPVTRKVSPIVSSMKPQFDAIGVARHGLKTWNSIEPATTRTMTIAIDMRCLTSQRVGPTGPI